MDVVSGIMIALIIGMIVGGVLWAYSIQCGESLGKGFLGWIGIIVASLLGGILLIVPCAVIWFYLLHKKKEKKEAEKRERSETM